MGEDSKLTTPEKLIKSLPEDSWLCDWISSWAPSTEMPYSYILFSAMAMLGACIGRKVWHEEDYRRILCPLNLLLIGPSGIGKSSSLEIARDFLLYNLPDAERPQFIGGATTMEKMHEMLVIQPQTIVYASELAAMFSRAKYMEPMLPWLTEVLDYGPYIERNIRSSGKMRVENPTVTVMGGSTKEWLTSALPDTAVGGGFLPRFLIVKEDGKRQKLADASMALSTSTWKIVRDTREGAIAMFPYLLTFHQGNVPFSDYDTADRFVEWYNAHQPPTGHLAPFAARAKVQVKRLAMLTALTCQRSEITLPDLNAAIEMWRYVEHRLQEVIVPSNQTGKLITSVLESIPPQGATERQIAKSVQALMTAQDAVKMLSSLMTSGDIIFKEGVFYKQEN